MNALRKLKRTVAMNKSYRQTRTTSFFNIHWKKINSINKKNKRRYERRKETQN